MLARGNSASLVIGVVFLALLFSNSSDIRAQSANVEVRAEGSGVFVPDTINGLYAMVAAGVPLTFVVSAELDFELGGATLFFRLYSPDASISTIVHTGNEVLDPWLQGLNLGAAVLQLARVSWEGILPDSFGTGGAALFSEMPFGPVSLTDIVSISIVFPYNTSGVFCIDSTFVPPAGRWQFSNGSIVFPTWGANSGGYPDGGYCISVFETCCDLPGDADGGGDVNIADAVYLIKYAFVPGSPAPPCLMEADIDGGGDINIADATYMVQYVFNYGPAPVCGYIIP